MKNFRNILLIAAGIFAVSCEEFDERALSEGEGSALIDLQISARIADCPDAATRTYMGPLTDRTAPESDYYPIFWSEGDKIGLVYGPSVHADVTISDGVGTNQGIFGGKAEDIVAPFPGTTLYPAAYPASSAFAVKSGDELLAGSYLPTVQRYKDLSFDDNVYPMAAVSAEFGTQYKFFNLAGVVQIQITSTDGPHTIRAIYFRGNDDEIVAGGIGMKFDASTGLPIASEDVSHGPEGARFEVSNYGTEDSGNVLIDFSAKPLRVTNDSISVVNIAILPQTFENGFTIELVDAINSGSRYVYTNESVTVARSCVKQMEVFNYAQPEPLEIANSYIYDDPGYYLMPAYCMGNRLDVSINPTDASGNPVDHKLKAYLLWTDIIDEAGEPLPAVTNIEYLSFSDGKGMLQFKTNYDENGKPYRGNAAIALYDEDAHEILWSWHVWMTDTVHDVITGGTCAEGEYVCQYPDGSKYHYLAESSSGKLIIMDRNLGAISANPEDGWKTYGLYYQNGRRDPFIGGRWNGTTAGWAGTITYGASGGENIDPVRLDETTPFSNETKVDALGVAHPVTERTWWNIALTRKTVSTMSPVLNSDGWTYYPAPLTVTGSLHNPMVFSSRWASEGCGQWTYYMDPDNKSWLDNDLAGVTSGTHGTTGLTDGGHEAYWNRTKTVMDPCPVGYSVLGERNGVFFGDMQADTRAGGAKDLYKFIADEERGIFGCQTSFTYNGVEYTTWWPAAGVRTFDGRMADVGYRGAYFHYDHIEDWHGGHGSMFVLASKTDKGVTTFNPSWTILGNVLTNHAASVRCVREKQFGTTAAPDTNLEIHPLH